MKVMILSFFACCHVAFGHAFEVDRSFQQFIRFQSLKQIKKGEQLHTEYAFFTLPLVYQSDLGWKFKTSALFGLGERKSQGLKDHFVQVGPRLGLFHYSRQWVIGVEAHYAQSFFEKDLSHGNIVFSLKLF